MNADGFGDLPLVALEEVPAEITQGLRGDSTSIVRDAELCIAHVFGVRHAVLVSSGTAAIHCGLMAVGVGPGDEVLVPELSVVMSAVPVLYLGAVPVFVDCAPNQVDFDYDDLSRKVSKKVKAVMAVHLWGRAFDMPRLLQFAQVHGLAVIEDACQAHGSLCGDRMLGTWGNVGCFSLQAGKLLATGEGGIVVTNDSDVAESCRRFRTHFADQQRPMESYSRVGQNYRITPFQARWAGAQATQLHAVVQRRRAQAEYIRDRLADLRMLEPYSAPTYDNANCYCPLFLASESVPPRRFADALAERGVRNSVGSFGLRPCHEWNALRRTAVTRDGLVSEEPQAENTRRFLGRAIALIVDLKAGSTDLDNHVAAIREATHAVDAL